MAKEQPAAEAIVEVPTLTLTEFCIRLSETVKSPELIGGFEFVETRAGHVKDTAAAFQARYDAFINTPV